MLKLFIINFYTVVFIFSAGIFFQRDILKKQNINNFYMYGIYGCIILSFLGLIINFFTPLNQNINTGIIVFFTLYFFKHLIDNVHLRQYLKKIIFVTVISIIIITLENSNRPDAGLYHLPYIQIINEEKIIIGLANIHFRFATNSIIQYLGAINFNYMFGKIGITTPLAAIVSIFLLYFVEEFLKEKKKQHSSYKLLFIFFTLIFILYSFNRYSGYGNDATASISFLTLIYIFLFKLNFKKVDNNILIKIYLISVFLFAQKLFYVLPLLIVFLIFLFDRHKIKYFTSFSLHLPTFFLLVLLIKNLLISGCFLYPLKFTCLNVDWLDEKIVLDEAISGQAWTKDWSNFKNKNSISKEEYIKKFNWLSTWMTNHAEIIIKKLTPLIIFFMIFHTYNKSEKKNYERLPDKTFIISLLICLIGTLLWFLKFPIYRYGSGYIFSSVLLLYILISKKYHYDKKRLNKFMISVLIIGFSIAALKNLNRIYKNYNRDYVDYPFPAIYSFNEKNVPEKLGTGITEYFYKEKFLFYVSTSGVCMYNLAPCTYYINKKVRKKNKFGYKVYYIQHTYE